MRFLVDENLSPALVQALRDAGHEAVGVVEIGLQGAPDFRVWRFAAEANSILITKDLDFPSKDEPKPSGLLLLRLPSPFTKDEIRDEVMSFLGSVRADGLLGKITVLGRGAPRVREL